MVLVKVGFEMDMRNVYSSSWVNYLALAILPLEGRFVGGQLFANDLSAA